MADDKSESVLRQRKPEISGDGEQNSPAKTADKKPPASQRSCVKSFCLIAISILIGVPLALAAAVFLWPSDCNSQYFEYPLAPEFVGPLERNSILSKAEKLYEGRLIGPEAVSIKNGVIYTGTADGRVLRIKGDKIEPITSTGIKFCDEGDISNEVECGRPLGARMDNEGNLIIVDTLYGVYRINISTGVKDLIFSTKFRLDGKKSIFLNDVAVKSDGTIYISDSSTKYTRPDFLLLGIENNPDGRIIRIDPKDGSASVVIDNIFPNGIQLSPDESHLIIADVVRARLLKFRLDGPGGKAERLTVFTANLPGNPDNLRGSSSGGYWVALTAVRAAGQPRPIWEALGAYPQLRNVVCKLYRCWNSKTGRDIRNMISTSKKGKGRKRYGLVVEVDEEGNITRSFHDPSGRIVGISHVEEYDGSLYFGSAFNNYMGKLDLSKTRQ